MFTWTEEKNHLNKKKHGFYFSEILDVFEDPHLLELYDVEHSTVEEERYICLGHWKDFIILSVVFVENDSDIRLITAREATPKERKIYDENFKKEIG